jgi:hypothetical protein
MRKDGLRLLAFVVVAAGAASLAGGCSDLVGVDFGAQHGGETDAGDGDDVSTQDVVVAGNRDATADAGGEAAAPCVSKTCTQQGLECGTQSDGCENAIDCGTCASGKVCTNGQCACVPRTCPELGVSCGTTDDGCGGALDCGTCAGANEACTNGKCACTPQSCSAQNATCGTVSDGCGGTYECGSCADGGAAPYCSLGTCGAAPCVPGTCGANDCGDKSDGCGGSLSCPGCTAPQSCGGGGTANVCGCTPTTCVALGKNCGTIPDGCGSTLDCGTCTLPESCDGAGTANVCGCTPTTCAALDKNCGAVANGCGADLSCGTCTLPDSCGGGGTANVCGCTPISCVDLPCGGSNGCGVTCPRLPSCGGGCFVAGTRIAMADGTTEPIDAVRPGESVRAYDAATGSFVAAPVLELKMHDPVASADGIVVVNGTLHVTTNHPIFVEGVRVRADRLDVGSPILLHSSAPSDVEARRDTVRSLELVPGGVPTYDLRVGGPGTYVADGIVVFLKD